MALTTLATLKLYLRKQTNAEDTLLTALLASATARVEGYLRRPIIAVSMTFTDEAMSFDRRCCGSLIVPITPIASVSSIEDFDEEEIDTDLLRFGAETGLITYRDGSTFGNGPYTIRATVGLSARAGYATRIEPVINQAILDIAADLYQRRNPAASQESEGGGVSVSYNQGDDECVPSRIAAMLQPYRMVGVA